MTAKPDEDGERVPVLIATTVEALEHAPLLLVGDADVYLLSHAYGDIFSLPDDIGLHFEHVDRHALAEADANIIREYIER